MDKLVEKGFPVVGAQCALAIVQGKAALNEESIFPIYHMVLQGATICFSNLNKKSRVSETKGVCGVFISKYVRVACSLFNLIFPI